MPSIYDWSTVASDNATSDSAINWAEGQAPSTVNNSARVMMQRGKEILNDIGGITAVGGTTNALTLTAASAFTAYGNGLRVSFRAVSDNTTAVTLNVNGIGAKPVVKFTTAGETALSGAEIQQTGIYEAIYSEALNGAAGAWLLMNPSPVAVSAFALTLLDDADAAAARTTLLAAARSTTITAGDGLTGGGDISANRTINLGTPSNITNSTTNSVTGTTHTHALGFTAAEVYTGTSSANTNYPIGTILVVVGTEVNRSASVTVDYSTSNSTDFVTSGGVSLSGTWRGRGRTASGNTLVQRTA